MDSAAEHKRILVIGGTGRTGRHVVGKLLERGHAARVLTRDLRRAEGRFGAEVEVFEGDVTRAESVEAALRGADGAVVIVESSTSEDAPNGPERAHYGGTRNVIAAASADPSNPAPHVVLVTQIYVTRPEAYPEARNITQWRARAEEALRGSGLPYTIVRPSWLTNDPGGREAVRLEQGDAGDGRIAREDVAEVCVQSLLNEEARGKTFEVYNEPGSPPEDWGALFASLSVDPTPTRGESRA